MQQFPYSTPTTSLDSAEFKNHQAHYTDILISACCTARNKLERIQTVKTNSFPRAHSTATIVVVDVDELLETTDYIYTVRAPAYMHT